MIYICTPSSNCLTNLQNKVLRLKVTQNKNIFYFLFSIKMPRNNTYRYQSKANPERYENSRQLLLTRCCPSPLSCSFCWLPRPPAPVWTTLWRHSLQGVARTACVEDSGTRSVSQCSAKAEFVWLRGRGDSAISKFCWLTWSSADFFTKLTFTWILLSEPPRRVYLTPHQNVLSVAAVAGVRVEGDTLSVLLRLLPLLLLLLLFYYCYFYYSCSTPATSTTLVLLLLPLIPLSPSGDLFRGLGVLHWLPWVCLCTKGGLPMVSIVSSLLMFTCW